LCEALLAIALILLSPFDCHVEGAKVMLQLEVDGAFGGRKNNLLFMYSEWDLVDLRDVLDRYD
jgi:hypothetical protein